MKIVKPLGYLDKDGVTFFLAGSIEMGDAENWQERVIQALANHETTRVTIF